jgi:hypothetical protein
MTPDRILFCSCLPKSVSVLGIHNDGYEHGPQVGGNHLQHLRVALCRVIKTRGIDENDTIAVHEEWL